MAAQKSGKSEKEISSIYQANMLYYQIVRFSCITTMMNDVQQMTQVLFGSALDLPEFKSDHLTIGGTS